MIAGRALVEKALVKKEPVEAALAEERKNPTVFDPLRRGREVSAMPAAS
jgi:hypothetical protein